MRRLFQIIFIAFLMLQYVGDANAESGKDKTTTNVDESVVVAYVTSWSDVMPNPKYITHINYAFGHVNNTFNGIRIDNEQRLSQMVELKKQNPSLKVLLSIGGWGSGRFSEMASDKSNRKAFAKDCKRIIEQFNLDGIDIDWEYPTQSSAKISSSPDDTHNFTLMMQDIRKSIGKKKLLTLASVSSAQYIDFKAILPYINFVNIMSYDMGGEQNHHAGLYRSAITGGTCDEAVKAHISAGVPARMLTMGMPFYGRGRKPFDNYADYNKIAEVPEGYARKWDDVAKVPFIADRAGNYYFGYDNVRSIRNKCKYINDNHLLGGMYWDYSGDNEAGDLQRAVYQGVVEKEQYCEPSHVLVITERGGQHGGFSDAGLNWLEKEGNTDLNFVVTEVNNAKQITKEFLSKFKLIIQLDFPPYTWPEEAQQAFIDYIDNGKGAWIGFHHSTLLGEFDGYPMWNWFSDFMGDIRFKNYIAPLANGTVMVEDSQHPVMNGVPSKFIIPDDEWYTYDKSPRANVHVLANVDESTYSPASDVKMGDHPVIWINENKKAKNVYFQMGHTKKLFANEAFTSMFRNAIEWVFSD